MDIFSFYTEGMNLTNTIIFYIDKGLYYNSIVEAILKHSNPDGKYAKEQIEKQINEMIENEQLALDLETKMVYVQEFMPRVCQ